MVVRCIICKNTAKSSEQEISFHRFPQDDREKQNWIKALGLTTVAGASRICSAHFSSTDFEQPLLGSKRKLKKDAVPSVNGNHHVDDENPQLINEPKTIQQEEEGHDSILLKAALKRSNATGHDEDIPCTKYRRIDDIDVGKVCTSPAEAKLCLEVAIETIHEQRTKIRKLQNINNKLRKSITNFKELVDDLKEKKFLSSEACDILDSNASPAVTSLVQKILSQKQKFDRFPPELRSFAATLHFYSPKAYDFVRRLWMNMLPHPATIRRWYTSVNSDPGISEIALQALKGKVSTAEEKNQQIFCSLMVDEMAIHQKVEWDGKQYVGFVDFGTKLQNNDLPEAKNAIVVMAVCINSHWKIPVAYHFIDSLTASERASMIENTLRSIHQTGVNIVSLTFDGPSYHFTMANKLGANVANVEDLQVHFPHPETDKPVYILLDACHMAKLIRNQLAACMELVDGEGRVIRWDYIVKLVDIQQSNGLHAATKIRPRHINFFQEKMKVCLAVQVLSDSTSKALRFCRESLKLPEFADSEGTEVFCKTINDIFDFLNSRNKFARDPTKQPLTAENYATMVKKVQLWTDYIKQLKYLDQLILNTRKKTGFVGMIISLKSVLELYKAWVEPNRDDMTYLLTYKLSQDHLELLFSAIRTRLGNNNNPTCTQFKSAWKKLLVHAQVSGSQCANSIAQDDTSFLHLPSTQIKRGIDDIYFETSIDEDCNEHFIVEQDHTYFVDSVFQNINKTYVDDIGAYIAGFIARKITAKISCEICIELLRGDHCLSKLQLLKDRGGLTVASSDVVHLCKIAEVTFREQSSAALSSLTMPSLIAKTLRKMSPNVFDHKDHAFEQGFLSDHRMQLIKAVLQKYFRLRLRHDANSRHAVKDRIRSKFNKLILFNHQ